jgi:hypothetical protein
MPRLQRQGENMRMVLAAFGLLVLGGCVATKPYYVSDSARYAVAGGLYPGKATVYVIRDGSFPGAAWPITVKLDGADQVTLRRETFAQFASVPGRREMLMHWNPLAGEPDVAINVELQADKTYYFAFSTSLAWMGRYSEWGAQLRQVDRSTGEAMTNAFKNRDTRQLNSAP